jgi:hypothetical protein
LVIAGSRFIQSFGFVNIAMAQPFIIRPTEIVSGTAQGVDRLGEKWAEANNIPVTKMPGDWNKYGKAAGPIRNSEMAKYCDAALVIWDGNSPGSKNMILNMRKLCKTENNKSWKINDKVFCEYFVKETT